MLTVDQALEAVIGRSGPLTPRRLDLSGAAGCPLAEDVAADLDLPPFRKALMDGYAVRAADVSGPVCRLRLGEVVPAGRMPSRPLAPGEAALIMTGAPLPDGADAVVMREQSRPLPDGFVELELKRPVAPGLNWMPQGREMRAGEVVLRRGERLNAARIGLLAAMGRPEVLVTPRPRVVVVLTGDELVEPDRVPGPGQIRNSNAAMLRALVRDCGAEAEAAPIAPDEPGALRDALQAGLHGADVLLVAGGVSAGDRDLVPAALESLGVACAFHKVDMKPGKPLWFGVGPARADGGPGPLVFGLPGNPVSGIVGVLLFVRPALDMMRGESAPRALGPARVRLAGPYQHRGSRPSYHPARLVGPATDGLPRAETLDWAGSADLRGIARADGFAAFPAGDCTYEEGQVVGFLSMTWGATDAPDRAGSHGTEYQ